MEHLTELIPVEHIAVVENALLQTFNTATVQEISLLAGGLSASAVFKILVGDKPYVLKIDPATAAISAQPGTMQIAAEAGIAPPVYYVNKAAGISITGFIKNIPIHSVLHSPELLLPQLAATIRRIHALPPLPAGGSLLATVDGLLAQFRASGMLRGPSFSTCFDYYEQIRKCYPWEADTVPSHNDLNPNNIVFDGQQIWVIDWDAAFNNNRYVDLAITANFYVTNEDQEQIFLDAYFGTDLNESHRARFFIMQQVCRLVYAMLMFQLADKSKPAGVVHDPAMAGIRLAAVKQQLGSGKLSLAAYEGQLLFGKALMNEALHHMQSPRFVLSLEQLG